MTEACTAAFLRLETVVHDAGIQSRERTEEDEDGIAMEDMILELEGPEALAMYQHRWALSGLPL